jgi:large subunit ribosomal protein L9
MKIILLENVRKVGSIGEVIDVKRGFARNFLISKKKALFASKENIKEVEKLKIELSKKDLEKKKEAKEINDKIQKKEYEVKKLATENKELYGSVKPTEIAKILEEVEKIKVNPSLIQPVNEIKSIGTFKVILNLHTKIQSEISIKVISEDNK